MLPAFPVTSSAFTQVLQSSTGDADSSSVGPGKAVKLKLALPRPSLALLAFLSLHS